MAKYRMTYPYARNFFTTLGRVEPGQVVDSTENPDPHFFEEVAEVAETSKSKKGADPIDTPADTATTPADPDNSKEQ